MARWSSYIQDDVGDGANTIAGIIANGPTYGIGISSDVYVTGIATFTDVVKLNGQLRDGDNNFGTSGQVLSSDGTDTRWVNAGSLSAGAASLVAINDDSNTNADRFITFVDSSSGNNAVKTDAALKYNPSTNTVSLVGGSIQSQNASGTRVTLMDTDGSIEITRESGPFIDFKTSTSEDHDCRIQMENDGLTFTTGGNGSALKRIKLDTNGHLLPITDSAFDIGSNTARFRNIYADDFTGNLTGNTSGSSGSCTGNAASATVLQTSRTIGGVSFNGSTNINLPGVNQAGNQNTTGNAATATVLETARNFSISGEITANNQSFNGSGNLTLSATVDDNVIDYNNLKASNRTSATNGQYLRKRSGNIGGMTWEDIPVVTGGNLTGNTLASGIVNSSLTSLGTLSGLSVNGNVSVTTGSITGNGSGLTTLNASNLSSGTIPNARFPSTLPAISGANLTNLDASDLSSGTVPAARLPNHSASLLTSGTIPAARLPNHSASLLTSGTIPNARFPSTLPTISGANLTSLNASNISSGTIPAARLPNHSASLLTSGTIPAARVPTLNQNTSGNAGSATVLQTARTIAGSSFNGSANISINYNNLTNKPSIPSIPASRPAKSAFAHNYGTVNYSGGSYAGGNFGAHISCSLTPSSSNNRVVIMAHFQIKRLGNQSNNQYARARITGGGDISHTEIVRTNQISFVDSFNQFSLIAYDAAGNTSNRTYNLGVNYNGGTGVSVRHASIVAIELSSS